MLSFSAKPFAKSVTRCVTKYLAKALVLGVFAGAMSSAPAWAGRHCEAVEATPEATANAFDAALQLKTWLDKTNSDVVFLARRGQNLEKYGLVYSHVGIALRSSDQKSWFVLHDLNKCASDQANLFEQGLAEFFSDSLYSTEVAVVVPVPELQALIKAKLEPSQRFVMHESHYSAVAYPFATKYQNSNGWVLETVARALSKRPLATRAQAQEFLKAQRYQPSVLNIGAMTRLGGRMFKANIAFDDHPGELRWSGKITVNTGDALMRFLSDWGVEQPTCQHRDFGTQVCVLPGVVQAAQPAQSDSDGLTVEPTTQRTQR